MTDRRFLLAVGGALVGAIGGAAAAMNGAPVAGIAAAAGAVVAGAGVLLGTPDPADAAAPATPTSNTASSHDLSAPTADTSAAPAPPALAPANAASGPTLNSEPPAGFAAPPGPPAPSDSSGEDGDGAGPALLIDPTTGLFSEDYFNIAIEARIAAARRHLRPVGVVLVDVVEGLRVDRVRPTDPIRVAEAIRVTLREADTACRRPDGKFALLLEDTPENGAIWTVERIRRRLVDADASLTVWAGIACYPAHAFDTESIVRSADVALAAAREWRQDRIEVALGD